MTEIRKQISLFLPLSEWKAVRREAARRRIPMTELCRQWMQPRLDEVRQTPEGSIPDDEAEFTHHP